MNVKDIEDDFFGPFSNLVKDDQDSVRLHGVRSCVPLARAYQRTGKAQEVLSIVVKLCGDVSWRVRYMVADKFCDLASSLQGEGKAFSAEEGGGDLVQGFVRLLQDTEAEVRTAAAFKVGDIAALLGAELTVKNLLPVIKQRVRDSSQYTRGRISGHFVQTFLKLFFFLIQPRSRLMSCLWPQF